MVDAKGNTWAYTYDLSGNQLTSSDPDKGLATKVYDPAGQITSSTEARGVTLHYSYDHLGRQTTEKDNTGNPIISNTWHTVKKGQLSKAVKWVDGKEFTDRVDAYDSAGRPTSQTTIVPQIPGVVGAGLAGEYQVSTSYNPDGSVKTTTLPAAGQLGAETLTYGYTAKGLPKTLTGKIGTASASLVQNTYYDETGATAGFMAGTVTGKSVLTTISRDSATKLVTYTALSRQVKPGGDQTQQIRWDHAGNLTQILTQPVEGQTDNQCFTYDALRQLTQAWTPAGETCDPATRTQTSLDGPAPYWTSWQHDVIGKTSQKTERTKTTQATTVFSYPGDGQNVAQPHFITQAVTTGTAASTKTYTTDQAGNTLTRPGPDGQTQTLEWDKTGDLTKISVGQTQAARMVYAADGTRAIRQEGGKTTLYVGGAEISQTGSGTVSAMRYYSLAGLAVAIRTGNNPEQTTTLVPDYQNTVSHQIDNATGELRTTRQTPYGDTRGQTPTGWTGDRGFVGGTKNTTGLTRIGARDYDPQLGKFITVDPIQNLDDPLQWNPYLYANNTPTTKSDPTGLDCRVDDGYARRPGQQSQNKQTTPAKPSKPAEIQWDTFGFGEAAGFANLNAKEAKECWFALGGLTIGYIFGYLQLPSLFLGDDYGNWIDEKQAEVAAIFGMDTNTDGWLVGETYGIIIGLALGGHGLAKAIAKGIQANRTAGAVLKGTDTVKNTSKSLRTVGSELGSVDDIFANPQVLKGLTPAEVEAVIGKTPSWKAGQMNKGDHVGQGWTFREWNARGTDYTGRYIQWHSGTPRHFNGEPYWKVSSGPLGTVRIRN
jgi:RHS repeat-associated protein